MKNVCGRCQTPLPLHHAGGNCPACLFGAALGDDTFDLAEASHFEETPAEIGDYEILGEIGRGGTSVVYRARQRRLNRIIALKALRDSALSSREAFERLQTEAEAVARLDHPHIVPIYEIGRYAGSHFLTLRYFEHGSLAEAIKERRFTPIEAACFIATASRAVHHAHSRGVLHRDLKPSNFLLDQHGAPHISDFGLAKLADGDSSLTQSAAVLGTPAYMAPEQAAGHAKDAGTPADIYALGAVLFELLTGRAPFLGRSALEVLRMVADKEPPSPGSLVAGLDRDLEAVCLRCLEKDPACRYASAAALAEDLDRWVRHEPLSIRPLTPHERALKWMRRRPIIAALSAGCALSLAFGFAGITWQWRRAEATGFEARQTAYVAEINNANQALEKEDWAGIRKLLDRTRPKPGEKDLRAWEWRYLWGVSQSDAVLRFCQRDRAILSLAALPDGHTIAAGEKEGGFSLWDTRSGQLVFDFPEPINRLQLQVFPLNRATTHVAMAPGTSLLAYTECRNEAESYVRLWDVNTHETSRSCKIAGITRNLAASPDGQFLACSTMQDDKRVCIFEIKTGKLLREIRANFADSVQGNPLAFSGDSKRIAFEAESGPNSATAIVDLATGKEVHRFPQEQNCVVSLAFSPDGRWLASGGGNDLPLVRIWDLQSGALARTLRVKSQMALSFDPQGNRLLAGYDIWRVPDFTKEAGLAGESGGVSAGCLLADGETYVTADSTSALKWNLKAPPRPRGGVALKLALKHGAFLPNGRGFLLISVGGMAYEALAPRYDSRPLLQLGTNCLSATILDGENLLVIGRNDGRVTFHNLADDYRMTGQLNASGRPVTGLWWLEQHGLLAVYRDKVEPSNAYDIEVWDLKTRKMTWQAESKPWAWRWTYSHFDGVSYDVFAEGRLHGLDLVKHRSFERQLDPSKTYTGAAFSSDGRLLLAT
jgi:tRNA A-37 threonylcarbamoyl transferase component Bud32